MRLTAQKRMLYTEVEKFSSFFDAYELHAKIDKRKNIGLATVYRFLNTLEKHGEIHSFMCNNKKIYSHNKTNHVHFTCEKCKKIKHVTLKNVDFLKEISDHKICHFQIELVGFCDQCRE